MSSKKDQPLQKQAEPLHSPVLPSWAGMLPGVPSAGYGDMSYRPADPSEVDANRPKKPLTKSDERMIALLPDLVGTKTSK